MTLLKFFALWLASSIVFFALLFVGVGLVLPRLAGTVHEPTRYERVDFSARKAQEDAAWGDPASPRARKPGAQGKAKEAAEDPHGAAARRSAACHGQNCVHDVRGEARGFLPYAN